MARSILLIPLRRLAAIAAVIFLLSCCPCQEIGTTRSEITLTNNGYEGVLIAIENTVPEDPLLIESIKKHFSSASALMFNATKKRAFFGHITILVPSTWTAGMYSDADKEDHSLANIVIHSDVSKLIPYTRQFEGCGTGGDQIFFHSAYAATEKATLVGAASRFPHDKTIVHEWAHLRWGVFDEFPVDKEDAKFYLDRGRLTAVKCGKYLKGTLIGRCTLNHETFLPGDECNFLPDNDDPGVTASLMYDTGTPLITQFCDNDIADPSTLHNSEAPNRQNKYCNGQSVWEVMRAHPDFSPDNGGSLPVDGSTVDTTPQFQVVRETTSQSTSPASDLPEDSVSDTSQPGVNLPVDGSTINTTPQFQVSKNTAGQSSSPASDLPEDSDSDTGNSDVLIAVSVSLSLLLVLTAVVVAFVCYRRRLAEGVKQSTKRQDLDTSNQIVLSVNGEGGDPQYENPTGIVCKVYETPGEFFEEPAPTYTALERQYENTGRLAQTGQTV